MKKIWINILCKVLFIIVVFGVILGLVDIHTDGILIRDAFYEVRTGDSQFKMDVIGGSQIPGALVQVIKISQGGDQTFEIKYVQGDEYAIMYENTGLCIAVASDKETVVAQNYDEKNDYNRWHIERIGKSQKYLLTNVATNTSLYYEYSAEEKIYFMKVGEYDEENSKFGFLLLKSN